MTTASPPAASGTRRAPARWTTPIGAALSAYLARRARFLSATSSRAHDARATQLHQLRALMRLAANTEVGRAANFTRALNRSDADLIRAYRDAIQPGDYEVWRARYRRMRELAQPDVTWPGVVTDWAQTSGTTGGEKYIPVSKHMMRSNYRAALDIFAHAKRFGVSLPHMFGGRLLFLGGSTDVSVNDRGIRTGDLSGLVTGLIKWPLSQVYTPGPEVALLSHWPTKIEAMAKVTLPQDIRFISGMASWSLVLFQRVLELARQRDPSITCLRDVWPHLNLFVHGGVRYQPFDARVREAWSGNPHTDIPHRLEVYPASEGFIAVQDTPNDPGLRLHTDHKIFFEFIPVEEINAPSPRAFMCDEVEKGQRYVVVMTTCAGMWRYIIGDVVEFDTIPPDGPPRLRIVGRHKHFINAFGENLIVEEIERAVVATQQSLNIRTGEFTAAPVYPAPGRAAGLELVVEWKPNAPDQLAHFARTFDTALRSINVDYNTKRTGDLGMGAPTITPVPIGAFHKWMEHTGKLGGQHKCPRCANTRDFVEGVIAANSE